MIQVGILIAIVVSIWFVHRHWGVIVENVVDWREAVFGPKRSAPEVAPWPPTHEPPPGYEDTDAWLRQPTTAYGMPSNVPTDRLPVHPETNAELERDLTYLAWDRALDEGLGATVQQGEEAP